jgi:hypothetical protein
MEPTKIIAVFLNWLQYNPVIFLPKSWKNLPQLDESLADFAEDELFPVAHTLSKWCAKNGLGEQLRQTAEHTEIDQLLEVDLTGATEIENLLPALRQSIIECYEAIQKDVEQ